MAVPKRNQLVLLLANDRGVQRSSASDFAKIHFVPPVRSDSCPASNTPPHQQLGLLTWQLSYSSNSCLAILLAAKL
jgi:hypothetical protein